MESSEPPTAARAYPDLPHATTSFGAAVLDGQVYVYGGHFGKAHHYCAQGQSGDLLRLNLSDPRAWQVVGPAGPRLQGLAMVAHGGQLFRVGGFEARNTVDEDQDLWSVADFTCFDPQTGLWQSLPPLPTPRSSFDAVVAGGWLYVVGGWTLQGDREASWPQTAFRADLRQQEPAWQEIAAPGFQRRALSLGTRDGNVYVIGGMQPDGAMSRETAVYDPRDDRWSAGPQLPGDDMDGFGSACCDVGGRLYVSVASGKLLRLSTAADSWEVAFRLSRARFFHRMAPAGDQQLLLMGGANMQTGKFASVESIATPRE